MLNFDPSLLRSFVVFDVVDAGELGADSLISRRFPSYNNFNTYRLRDPASRGRDLTACSRAWQSDPAAP